MPFAAWLKERRREPELMDQPGLDSAHHFRALRGLGRINLLSNSAGILWPPLVDLARRLSPQPVRVLDVATGGGDLPIRLWRRARRGCRGSTGRARSGGRSRC